jgi:hypothetical protein
VQAAGFFVYRHEEPENKLPSLYTSSGGERTKKAKAPALPLAEAGGLSSGGKLTVAGRPSRVSD